MAVSKRIRYEVLRRDNHTCRYCGGRAPDVVLTVDHVVPTALGGSDVPSNLVAACKDCNAGKTSVQPDAPLVQQVSADALRWSQAMAAAAAAAAADVRTAAAYREEFEREWTAWTYGWQQRHYELTHGWEASVDRWRESGLPMDLLVDAIRIAMNGPAGPDAKFRYLAGVVNRKLASIHDQARASMTAKPAAASSASGSVVDVEAFLTAVQRLQTGDDTELVRRVKGFQRAVLKLLFWLREDGEEQAFRDALWSLSIPTIADIQSLIACGHCMACQCNARGELNDRGERFTCETPANASREELDDEMACKLCGDPQCLFIHGEFDGSMSGWQQGTAWLEQKHETALSADALLRLVVDGPPRNRGGF